MATQVMVNGRTVVHKKSDGVSICFPDPCLTPTPAPSPVPYTNIARSSDAANGATTVTVDGVPLVLKRSYFAVSTGDEPGTAGGGVVSGRIKGKASFLNYSFDVLVEGENVPRLGDPMLHNHGSQGNGINPSETQPPSFAGPDKELLCAHMCACDKAPIIGKGGRKLKQLCVSVALQAEDDVLGNQSRYKPEISYNMTKSPPKPIMSRENKLRGTGYLPARLDDIFKGAFVPGTGMLRRPDVVIVKDVTKSPTQDNIEQVVEMKFPGDTLTDEQHDAYVEIAGDKKKFTTLHLEDCNCPKEPAPAPQPLPEPSPWEVALLLLALAALVADDAVGGEADDLLIPGILARLGMAF